MPTDDPKVLIATQKAFMREFPRTEEGLALQLHAQLYFGYIPLYIYYMKLGMSAMIPDMNPIYAPEYPKGIEFEILDGMVKCAVNRCAHNAADLATNTYHAKVVRLEEAEQVLTLTEDLNLGELPKTVMPYEHAVTAVIKNPDRIAVIDCICRKLHGDKGCQPLDVCLVIGEPWVSWVMARDNRMNARLVTQDEALTILRETHERGNVHAVFFKDVAAGRIYSICNCCPCCCTAIQAQNHLGAPMMERSGYTAVIDEEKCIKCGICAKKCNFMAIEWNKGEVPVVSQEMCMGCEGCIQFCKQDAISLELTDPESPFNIKDLIAKNQ